MTDAPYTLVGLPGTEDREFPSMRQLARAIVRLRDALPRGENGEPREISMCARDVRQWEGLQGAAVMIRARVTAEKGPGELIGYAFLPDVTIVSQKVITRLMDEVLAAVDEQAAARAQRETRKEAA